MAPLDLAIVAGYLLLTLGLGWRIARRQATSTDYFLGARDLPAFAVLLSIVATETSALTVISVPGVGARGDLGFLQLAFGYLVGRIGVAVWLLPGYFHGEQETAYQRLESRFGPGTRRTLSATFLVTRFLADGVRIFAGAIPLALATGWTVSTAILMMGVVTIAYTLLGGLRAVIWADVIQLAIYVTGGIAALGIAWSLAGGPGAALAEAGAAGRLQMIDPAFSLTRTYTLLGGLVGGAMLSAASHGTDHLIVQRLLATRSLRQARIALVGSGVAVIGQFLLFLLVGSAIWAAGFAPEGMLADEIFPRFIIEHLPTGLRGLLIAGILAAAMSTISSSINALASSVTYDWYAARGAPKDPTRLLRAGRWFSAGWGLALVGGALLIAAAAARTDTPIVVLALSIASITYGALLGTYILASERCPAAGTDAIAGAVASMLAMLGVVFARTLVTWGVGWMEPLSRLAWPWFVPLGTALTVTVGLASSLIRGRAR